MSKFAAEYTHLQKERIAPFGEFKRDVERGDYPASDHTVRINDGELEVFLKQI
jgi:3-methyl-2-oxobutanoate hydroxymethyltransferase